jgi:hypothetical protein
MASKNLGAVIQRAISDGAFRRQLQSDPAAALRGFNLTSDEIAAIRSGDSSKLMSLGVDQRMSKAFSVGGAMAGGARQAVSDLSVGGTASTIANDPTAGAREGIVGDPSSTSREALTGGNVSGTRAIHDSAPFDSRAAVSDPALGATRAVNDSEPFAGNAVVNDNIAAANAGRAGSLTGDMSVSSQMADAGTADSIRGIHDVAPFDSGVNTASSTGGEFLTGDARLDPGTDSAHGFVPSDSADVQREMLDGGDHGNALGNTGTGHPS